MPAKSKNNAATSKGESSNGLLIWVAIIAIALGGMLCYLWRDHSMVASCTTENLKLTAGQQNGAAGTIYQHMALTNTGKKSCTMAGYPTAFLFGNDGYALGNSAAAQAQPAPAVITLAPGETAHTVLGYPQAGNFPPGQCTAAKSTSLKLYPPSSITPLTTSLEVAWCPGFSETAMQAGN
jgi:hypothetical protein